MAAAIADWLALAGVLFLAVPAFAAERTARRLNPVVAPMAAGKGSGRTDERFRRLRDSAIVRRLAFWRREHSVCLYAGYASLLLSALLRL